MSAPHVHSLRVYYEDTDFSGFVYHAGYLRFLERGRTEFLRSLGISQSTLRADDGLVFVVSRIAIDYLRPAVMDDLVEVATTLEELRGASMRLAQVATRTGDVTGKGDATGEGTTLVRADVTVAAVREGRPVRLPDALRSALGASRA